MSASYRDLRVWQQGIALVLAIYKHTRAFSREELYGLTSQMRRAAVSIPSNIAEGKGRSSDRDRRLFFCHARASLLELETQISIARDLQFLPGPEAAELIESSGQLGRMLNSLIESLQPQTGRHSWSPICTANELQIRRKLFRMPAHAV